MGRFLSAVTEREGAVAARGQALSELEAQIIANVATHGWHCAEGVETRAEIGEDGSEIAFACTAGFWEIFAAQRGAALDQFPEFIVFGLPADMSHLLLWQVFCQIRDQGTAPVEGARWSDLVHSFECVSRPVDASHLTEARFEQSLWYRRHRAGPRAGIEVQQLFWPSRLDGRYPWESGCAQSVRDLQPALYLPAGGGAA
jgi:hypothetical protein